MRFSFTHIIFIFSFFYLSFLKGEDEAQFTIQLEEPHYKEGKIFTDQGGIITSPDLRIQARHIVYTNKTEKGTPIHQVTASGDLLIEKRGQIFVGNRLEYDFITNTGTVFEGATSINFWFLGGEKIELNSDKSISLLNAFLTTSESKKTDLRIQSSELEISDEKILRATNVTFRFYETPILWIPFYKSNLKKENDSPLSYNVELDKGLFPRFQMRYRAYSSEVLDLFLRLDIRPSKGAGGAIESNYKSLDRRTLFYTRNFASHDAFYRDDNPDRAQFRYRLQGKYRTESEDEQTYFLMKYDKFSDKNLPSDFNSNSFELNPDRLTAIEFRNYKDRSIIGINATPRINSFQGFNQELPTSFVAFHPFQIGSTGIVSQNRLNLAYLDYVSAKDLDPFIPDFQSARLETLNEFICPLSIQGVRCTPILGLVGIFYNKTQKKHPAFQALLKTDLFLDTSLKRNYPIFRNVIQPYIHYNGIIHPTLLPDTPFIFSIHDGYNRLSQLKTGIRSLFYSKEHPLFTPNFIIDLHAYSFFGDNTFKKTTPKVHGIISWNFPRLSIQSHLGWNVEEELLDFANIGIGWTISKDFAFKSEFRHRSRFDWRKDDPENFIMEVTRPIHELLHSPLSDGRNTLLSRLQIKIAPQWTLQLESHIGWGRGDEPNYNEIQVNLKTIISSCWEMQLTYVHSPTPDNKQNDRFLFNLKLLKI